MRCAICSEPAKVFALSDSSEPVPYCAAHGPQHGAKFPCERCGRHRTDVGRVSMVGHVRRPAKARPGVSTSHMLCGPCVSEMEQEQPPLFG
jgi:hypothetical protein